MTHPLEPWARADLEFLVSAIICDTGGGVLEHVDAEDPLAVGDLVVLSPGTLVEVVHLQESIRHYGWFQMLVVAPVPGHPTPVPCDWARREDEDFVVTPTHGTWPHVLLTVRDARFGRDPGLATHAGGEVLDQVRVLAPVTVGDVLELPDGTRTQVVGSRVVVTPSDWLQVVEVGDEWPSTEALLG